MADGTDGVVISVMLIVPDAAAAIAWYRTALGATQLWDLGGVARLEVNGARSATALTASRTKPLSPVVRLAP